MKIGVITFWTSNNNYGQLLQCYAFQKALKSMGHDPFLIQYQEVVSPSLFEKLRRITPAKLKAHITGESARYKKRQAYIAEMDRKRDFDAFRKSEIAVSTASFSSIEELRDNPPKADVYICGSDQVWHEAPLNPGAPTWFLDFGAAKKVSYAASISRELNEGELPSFKRYLNNFSGISLREDTATELCRSLGFSEAQTVLDPTLLIADFQYPRSGAPAEKDKYLFAYIVNVARRDDALWGQVADFAAERGLGVKPVYSSGYELLNEFLADEYETLWPTIPQWLDGVRRSECVVTTSFHGVALSIVMHRPFLSIPLSGEKAGANARVETLLRTLGLSDRIYTNGSFSKAMLRPIDWGSVDARLAVEREKSLGFLKRSIE